MLSSSSLLMVRHDMQFIVGDLSLWNILEKRDSKFESGVNKLNRLYGKIMTANFWQHIYLFWQHIFGKYFEFVLTTYLLEVKEYL